MNSLWAAECCCSTPFATAEDGWLNIWSIFPATSWFLHGFQWICTILIVQRPAEVSRNISVSLLSSLCRWYIFALTSRPLLRSGARVFAHAQHVGTRTHAHNKKDTIPQIPTFYLRISSTSLTSLSQSVSLTLFSLDLCPWLILTELFLPPTISAKACTSSLFASPSCAGAAIWIATLLSDTSVIQLCLAPGLIWITMKFQISPSFTQMHAQWCCFVLLLWRIIRISCSCFVRFWCLWHCSQH